jgi:esterase
VRISRSISDRSKAMSMIRAAVPLARSVMVQGSGPNVPLLMLHGALAAGSTYASLLRRPDCAPQASLKLAPDLRGHGRSPHAARYTYGDMVADVAVLLQDIAGPSGDGKVDICGHSMGGKVAMALALLKPQLVRRSVVVDIAPVDYREHNFPRTNSAGHVGVPLVAVRAMCDVEHGLRRGMYPTREHVDKALKLHGVEDPRVRLFVATNLVPALPRGAWSWRCDVHGIKFAMESTDACGILGFQIFKDQCSAPETHSAIDKHVFESPTLFITGGKSSYVNPDRHHDVITSYFPDSTIITLEHCGHWLQSEDPQGFCLELSRFLIS